MEGNINYQKKCQSAACNSYEALGNEEFQVTWEEIQ